MATRKQRRRREKEHRHDYEFVYVDHEGNEVEPDEAGARTPGRKEPPPRRSGSKTRSAARTRGRVPDPPSWQRSVKRGLLFTPAFVAVIFLLDRKHGNVAGALISSIFLLVIFVPFSYFLDAMMWRQYQKRGAQSSSAKR